MIMFVAGSSATSSSHLPKDNCIFVFLQFQSYILVYDVTRYESFNLMDKLKKEIEKSKDRREVTTIINIRFTFYYDRQSNLRIPA